MSSYPPPTENVPVFDAGLFLTNSTVLTIPYLNTLFLKYPVAQTGLETLSSTVTTGTSEFQGSSQFNSALVVSNGKLNTSLGNGFSPLAVGQGTQNVFVGVGAGSSALCGDGNTVVGYFAASQGMNSAATQNVLYGSRAGQYLSSGSGNTLIGNTTYNNIGSGNSNICLGNGAMGGEASGAYSNNIVIGNAIVAGGSNKTIIGTTTQTSMNLVCSQNPTMSGFAQPAAGNSSQNIATTAWVQSAITAGGGAALLSSANIWTGTNQFNNNVSTAYNFTMNSVGVAPAAGAAQRQINASYYNFYDANNDAALVYTGRFYSGVNSIVYDCPTTTTNSSHVFYCYSNPSTAVNCLTINNISGVTCALTQPASSNSTTWIPTTAWVQSAILGGALKQTWSWNAFNITSSGVAGTRNASLILPYPNATTFSTTVRVEFNYAVFANSINAAIGTPTTLNNIAGTPTNVNPNQYTIIDFTFNSVTQAMVAFANMTNFTNWNSSSTYTVASQIGNGYVPLAYSTQLNTPSAGLMTLTLGVTVPNQNYSAASYIGNLMSFSTNLRILSSQTTVSNTPTSTNTSSGVAYFA